MNTELFSCDVCDGPVVMTTGPGRVYDTLKGQTFYVPQDYPTAVCQECGCVYLSTLETQEIAALLGPSYPPKS